MSSDQMIEPGLGVDGGHGAVVRADVSRATDDRGRAFQRPAYRRLPGQGAAELVQGRDGAVKRRHQDQAGLGDRRCGVDRRVPRNGVGPGRHPVAILSANTSPAWSAKKASPSLTATEPVDRRPGVKGPGLSQEGLRADRQVAAQHAVIGIGRLVERAGAHLAPAVGHIDGCYAQITGGRPGGVEGGWAERGADRHHHVGRRERPGGRGMQGLQGHPIQADRDRLVGGEARPSNLNRTGRVRPTGPVRPIG